MSGIPWNATHVRARWKQLAGESLGPVEGRSLRGGRGPKIPETDEELKEAFEFLWKHLVLLDYETRRPLLEGMVQVCAGQMGPYRWRRLQPTLQHVLSEAPRIRLAAEPGSKGRVWAHQILATHRALQEEFRQERVARTDLLDRLEKWFDPNNPNLAGRMKAGRKIRKLVREGSLSLDKARDVLHRGPRPEGEEFLPLEVAEITWVNVAD